MNLENPFEQNGAAENSIQEKSFQEMQKYIEEIFLHDLGLSWENLRGKKILDIGTGSAEFAKVAKDKGIEVVSLEKYPHKWGQIYKQNYLQAEAENLPFKKGSFDLVLSHAAPPLVFSEPISREEAEKALLEAGGSPDTNKEQKIEELKAKIRQVIVEAKRVLREGGEFRFGPGGLTSEMLGLSEKEKSLPPEQQAALIKKKSLAFLKKIDPNIQEKDMAQKEGNASLPPQPYFYVLKKGSNKSNI